MVLNLREDFERQLELAKRNKKFIEVKDRLNKLEDFLDNLYLELNILPVIIDHNKPFREMIVEGKYSLINSAITSDHFPFHGQGRIKENIRFYKLGYHMSWDTVLEHIEKDGFRPANMQELMVVAIRFPNLHKELIIGALGSVWYDKAHNNKGRVPVLRYKHNEHTGGFQRWLYLLPLDNDWHNYQLAVVRKENKVK